MTDLRHGLAAVTLVVTLVGCSLANPPASPPASSGASPAPTSILASPSPSSRPRRSPRPTPTDAGEPTPGETAGPGATATPAPTAPATPGETPRPSIPGLADLTGSDGRLTVLLLGSDARPGLGGERTDVIMVATIDPATGKVAMVSLPRDMRDVPYGPGQVYPLQVTGLMQQFELNGMSRKQALKKMKAALGYAFGVEIDYYAIVKFLGVVELIDAIHGVDVKLAAPFDDASSHLHHNKGLHLKKGVNHLNGRVALAFARSRHTTTDYDRSRRQQVLITAVMAKVRKMDLASLGFLTAATFEKMDTDIPLKAVPALYGLAEEARLNGVKGAVLGPSTFASTGSILYSIYIKLAAVRALFAKIFG